METSYKCELATHIGPEHAEGTSQLDAKQPQIEYEQSEIKRLR